MAFSLTKSLLLLALAAPLATPAWAQAPGASSDYCLTSEQVAINGIRLLDKDRDVAKLLGKPLRSDSVKREDDGGEFYLHRWFYRGQVVEIGRSYAVEAVSTTSRAARLPSGLRIGQTLPQVAKAIGLPDTSAAAYGQTAAIRLCADSTFSLGEAGLLLHFTPVYGAFDPPAKRTRTPTLSKLEVSFWGE